LDRSNAHVYFFNLHDESGIPFECRFSISAIFAGWYFWMYFPLRLAVS